MRLKLPPGYAGPVLVVLYWLALLIVPIYPAHVRLESVDDDGRPNVWQDTAGLKHMSPNSYDNLDTWDRTSVDSLASVLVHGSRWQSEPQVLIFDGPLQAEVRYRPPWFLIIYLPLMMLPVVVGPLRRAWRARRQV